MELPGNTLYYKRVGKTDIIILTKEVNAIICWWTNNCQSNPSFFRSDDYTVLWHMPTYETNEAITRAVKEVIRLETI